MKFIGLMFFTIVFFSSPSVQTKILYDGAWIKNGSSSLKKVGWKKIENEYFRFLKDGGLIVCRYGYIDSLDLKIYNGRWKKDTDSTIVINYGGSYKGRSWGAGQRWLIESWTHTEIKYSVLDSDFSAEYE